MTTDHVTVLDVVRLVADLGGLGALTVIVWFSLRDLGVKIDKLHGRVSELLAEALRRKD